MVRTSGGIRITAGKSSKKGGSTGSGNGGGSNRSLASTSGGKSSSKASNRLPPIPHCEAPSWQKPITNFFNSDAGSSKNDIDTLNQDYHKGESSRGRENVEVNLETAAVEKTKEVAEKDSNNTSSDDEQLPEKRRKKDKTDAEKLHKNSETNSVKVVQNEDKEYHSEKQSTDDISNTLIEKNEVLIEKSKSPENSFTNEHLPEKKKQDEEKDKENIDGKTAN